MKKIKNKMRYCFIISILLLAIVACYEVYNVPTTIFLREGENFHPNKIITLKQNESIKTCKGINVNENNIDVSLLGLLKLKSVSLKSVPKDLSVYPGGQPIGVKLNTRGVLVVGLSDLETDNGKVQSPAAKEEIVIGDSILKINDAKINSSEKLMSEININKDKTIEITIERKNKIFTKKVKAIKCHDGNYKIGLWVRDSTAGVGTLTFYDDNSRKFGALGHPITDLDTGTILNVNSGEIVKSSIVSVKKGQKGSPGELRGIFVDEDMVLGEIYKNTQCGIFGKCNIDVKNKFNKKMKLALRNEIKEGPAQIITTIDGNEPGLYNVRIEKLLPQNSPGPKSMVIKVTDKNLLKKTGGIVQGMSGSPIIQNNKIVGAVTHVLINKPDTGYGIYIEWMLKDSRILE